MRHARSGKKLGRDSAHRRALYANLACALIEHGRIRTTEAKAKAVKPFAEKMITLGRRGDLAARRQAISELRSQAVVKRLFDEVAPRFADRPGGYSRIVKLGPRAGDSAAMAYLELKGGRERVFDFATATAVLAGAQASHTPRATRPRPLAPRLSAEEAAAHTIFVSELGEAAIWKRFA